MGTPSEEILEAKTSGQGDSGKLYSLTFSKTKEIYGSGRSKDFTAGRGGWRGDFSGYENEKEGVKSYIDIVNPRCETMGTQNTFQGNIDFNLPKKEVSGARLFLPVLSSSDIIKINNLYKIPSVLKSVGEMKN